MHGLFNKAFQAFIESVYGRQCWIEIIDRSGTNTPDFEPMMTYDFAVSEAVISACEHRLKRPREAILEDLGSYLVSNPEIDIVRRLLRFSGATYTDFIHALDELPGRARMALDDIVLPHIYVTEITDGFFAIKSAHSIPWANNIIAGVLRGMADDYGALATVEIVQNEGEAQVEVLIHDANFAVGKAFDMAASVG